MKATRWAIDGVLIVIGVVWWFAATYGWQEYGKWIAPVTAFALSILQLLFWTVIAPRRDGS